MSGTEYSFDDFDAQINPRDESTDFDHVVEAAIDRRGFLGGVVGFGIGSFIASTATLPRAAVAQDRFGFSPVAATTDDTITLPEGYIWKPLIQWGDPLWSDAAKFDEETRGTAASQARAFGDNNDGMAIFARDGRVVMAVNNEYTNRRLIWGNRPGGRPQTADDIEKGMMAHGLSVFEIAQSDNGDWQVVRDSDVNRRITPQTEMALTGPAAGDALLRTEADHSGTKSRGTWNNCGNGETLWGTYLTCEENFNGYFSSSHQNVEIDDARFRYGISTKDWGYNWATIDARFDISRHPNEPNRAGYVVEVDPFDPTSTPRKRTALGRFKHENAALTRAADGRIVVYMGDDERGEFLYRFVSHGTFSETDNNSDLLDSGDLFVAKFHDDVRGEWLALTPETTQMTQAEICILTRLAASRVGATTMDRPEWVAVNPTQPEAYVALTNNKHRGRKANRGGDKMPLNGPNPRAKNRYGQIARWMPDNGDHGALGFTWGLFALAGNPEVHNDDRAGSANINATNMFNAPDGMAFDTLGKLWIQTDGKVTNAGDFAGMGNNQMLVGDTTTGDIRRFMVGPRDSEVTGLCWSPDRKTMFVGIQHPGDKGNSSFPNGGTSVPRSGVFAITRTDGGRIG